LTVGINYWLRRALFILIAILAALLVAASIAVWSMSDTEAYWQAALRLRAGEPLYPAAYDPLGSDTYRYAPWFAALWVPLTLLPRELVVGGWAVILIAATAYCAWRAWLASPLAALVLVPPLTIAASFGNVQPILVAALIWNRGPWMVGLAAGVKAAPLLLAAGWRWRRVALSAAVAAALWAPALLMGAYPTRGGTLLVIPLWVHLAGAAALAAAAWRFPRYRLWLATGAAIMAMPRFHLYDLSLLLERPDLERGVGEDRGVAGV
jgi:hypothetical protein